MNLLLVGGFLVILFSIAIVHLKRSSHRHSHDIQKLEDEVLRSLYGDSVISKWLSVPVKTLNGSMESWDTHYLIPGERKEEKRDVLLLHGYGATSAFTWRVTIPELTKQFNVFAIDMPGFGRTEAPPSLLETDLQDTHDAYCEFYDSAIKAMNIRKPLVIAHSFGGFVFTQCAARKPDIISKLVLVSVPGIFPSNGGFDFLWSNYFYLGLPHNLIQWLGDLAHVVYDPTLFLLNSTHEPFVVRYWHLYHTDQKAMKSDVMVRKFIKHFYYYSIGKATSLVPLLHLSSKVPVATVYGTKDVIVPHQQGQLIQNISLNAIPTFVIKGAHHVTHVHNGGQDFVKIAKNFFDYNNVSSSGNAMSKVASCLEEYEVEWNTYPCVPSYTLSNYLQQRMHSKILDIVYNKCRSD